MDRSPRMAAGQTLRDPVHRRQLESQVEFFARRWKQLVAAVRGGPGSKVDPVLLDRLLQLVMDEFDHEARLSVAYTASLLSLAEARGVSLASDINGPGSPARERPPPRRRSPTPRRRRSPSPRKRSRSRFWERAAAVGRSRSRRGSPPKAQSEPFMRRSPPQEFVRRSPPQERRDVQDDPTGEFGIAQVVEGNRLSTGECTFRAEITTSFPGETVTFNGRARTMCVRGPTRIDRDQAQRDAELFTDAARDGPNAVRAVRVQLHEKVTDR